MATNKNFEVKNGLSIAGTERISSAGVGTFTDLNVTGTTTTIDTATLQVQDKNIVINYGSGDTSSTASGAGITIQDAVNSSTDATLLWDASADEFDFSHTVTAPTLTIAGDATFDTSTLKVDSTNNRVGIGTSSPVEKLDVIVDATGGLKLGTNADAGVTLTSYQGSTNSNVRTIDFNVQNFVVNTGSPTGTTVSEAFRVTNDGNVGIGTASPLTNLHIGSGTAGENLGLKINRGATTNFLVACDGTKQAYIGVDNSDAYIKLGSLSNHPVQISQNNANAIYIDTSKNVGIGTNSPSHKLTIAGNGTDIQFNYNNTVPNNPLHTAFYGGWTGIGMDQTTAGMRIAGEYVGNTNPIVDFGYYASGTVSHANWNSKMKIESNGNVGIGETTPLAKLHIKRGDSGLSSLNAAGDHIFLENTGANGTGITLASGNTANGSIIFGDQDSNYRGVLIYDHSADAMKFVTAASERMRIDSSGIVDITGGTLKLGSGANRRLFYRSADNDILLESASGLFYRQDIGNTNHSWFTGNTERMRILAGGGLTFNGDTAAANALDDYEEGTWTPVLTTTGGTAATHSQQTGQYTKIGNMVHVHGTIRATSGANASGTTIISGLPFTSLSTGGTRNVGSMGAMNGAGTAAQDLRLVCDPNSTFIYVIRQTGQNYDHFANFNSAVDIYGFSIVYSAA